MAVYALKRLALVLPVLLGVTVVVFSLVHLIPGDPAVAIAGEKAPAEVLERVRAEYGFDLPLHRQFADYVGRILLHGDFGRSYQSKRHVTDELKECFPATIELAIAAMIIATLGGVAAGIISSVRPYSLADHTAMAGAMIGVSMPVFFLGMILLLLFQGILPGGGRLDQRLMLDPVTHFYLIDALFQREGAIALDYLKHLILPAVTLSTVPIAVIARMTRTSMLDELHQDYVRTAKAKGLSARTVVLKHALRNALVPIVTTLGLQFGSLLAGAVLTESVFQWNGIGNYVVDAIVRRDLVALQAGILVIAAAFVLVNLAVDLTYAWIDPRIRYA